MCDFSHPSRFAQRLRRRYPAELALLAPGVPLKPAQTALYAALRQQGLPVGAALRVLRQCVLERLVSLDDHPGFPLVNVTQAMTDLAEFALATACEQAFATLDALHGAPMRDGPTPQRAQFWVVGMGKLGARELNVSSDIDLIYVYEGEGETLGIPATSRGRLSHHEYFGRAVKLIFQHVGEVTEHGFVFRMDLALRPHGSSGPAAISLGALDDYFAREGREWERLAWLKSRVVAPMAEDPPALRAVVLPFVYRRYLDYRVFDALRKLHRQIRNHTDQHGQAHPARANDVKLGRGGIREIEFTVQLLQVVRGGQYPELRHRGTLLALERLCAAGLIAAETADALAQAYVFLRQLEHRIQYLDDQQTHALPTAQADLLWCSETLGFACIALFLAQLAAHRACVAKEFDQLLGGQSQGLPEALEAPITTHGKQTQLAAFYQEPRVLALGDDSRQRVGVLLQRTMDWAQNDSALRETALPRFLDWLGPLLRRESYLALLQERPQVHRRLLRLLTAAAWPARYLQRHPGVIDELADARLLNAPFVPAELTATLDVRRRALAAHGEDDDDHLLNTLRRAHHAELFRILAQDVEGLLTVEQVADALSALADTLLRVTTDWCWARLCQAKSLNPELAPAFAIIAYGKLGGKELGYGSDLDLVFLYDDSEATDSAPPLYAALVRKLITWLSVKTGEGDLYEIDTALRPNGQSGLLVTSLAAYTHYQLGRGSNTAWTWEHQAMTRARCVLGPPTLIKAFDAVRHSVITAPRDTAALRQEVVAMRDKMRQAHPQRASPHFDVKHSPGGMVDVEFAVQLLVLAHSAQHPALSHNSGNIALLLAAEAAQLLPIGMGQSAAQAYRQLRLWQHRARLNEGNDPKAHLQSAEIATARSAVNALWAQLMGTKPIAPAAP